MNYNLKALFLISFTLTLSIVTSFDSEYFEKYKGYTVYNVLVNNEDDLKQLKLLESKFGNDLNYWTELNALNRPVHIMIKPSAKKLFEYSLKFAGLKYEIFIPDVSYLIRKQIELNMAANTDTTLEKLNDFDYGKYHTLDEINDWMNDFEKTYPKYVTIFNVSRSYQKRDIYAMKISIPNASNKPAIWFDGGIHAREWISPATVIYMAYSFLTKYNVDSNVTDILNAFDIYVLPVFNVDGYEYTWAKDRMWRKTRSKTIVPICIGVDPNRNWDDHLCESGASRDPCSDSYCGLKPFSESEVRGVADFLLDNINNIVSYINFHSYSQLWMTPWGWTTDLPTDFKVQDGGSIVSLDALTKLYGTKYQHGNIASTIYLASGSSVDWTYDKAGIIYSYAVELRDTGENGFLLPPDQIIPSGLETFEALKALAFYIKGKLEEKKSTN